MQLGTVRTVISTLIGAALCTGAYARDDLPNYNALADQGASAQARSTQAHNGATRSKATKQRGTIAPSAQATLIQRAVQAKLVAAPEAIAFNKDRKSTRLNSSH